MNIHDIEAFVAVVETGSIVRASVRLNITQPGITRRIQNLESRLGAQLLDRQSKPLRPTSSGREAYAQGREILRSIEELKRRLDPAGDLTGELRLGIMPYLSEAALALPVDRLREAFPRLTLRIVSGWSPVLLDLVERGEIDGAALCLAAGAMPPDGLAGEPLSTHSVVLVAARSLGLPRLASFAELSRHPFVMNEGGCGFRGYLRNRFEAAGLPFHVGVEALSADLRLSLVARGHGIGLVTQAGLDASAWRDQLVVIECADFLRPSVRSWVVHRPPANRLSQPLAVFRDAFAEAMRAKAPLAT